MERQEFIAEAKKQGATDSSIQSRLELYDEFAATDTPLDFEFLLKDMPSETEIDFFLAGPPPN